MIHTSIDLDRPGKQQGFLQVPYSHDLGGWANVMIPCTIITRGSGPTVLILAGNHGDEYEGPIVIGEITRELDPAEVQGRLILMPSNNIHAAIEAIASSVERAERASSSRILSAHIGIAGPHISSMNQRGIVAIADPRSPITEGDIHRALESARIVNVPNNREVVHVIPRYYVVDAQDHVVDPLGMFGSRLDVETHVITAGSSAMHNLVQCIEGAGVRIESLVLEPLAAAREDRAAGAGTVADGDDVVPGLVEVDRDALAGRTGPVDPARRQMRLLFGGKSGDATIALMHVPASFGGTVRVRVREIDWTGQLGDASPPVVVGDRVVPVIAALALINAAYLSQSVQAGITAIGKGQWMAGAALGMTRWQTLRYVILPPALRHMLPSFINQWITLLKDSSLAYVVGVAEFTFVATQINNREQVYPLQVFGIVAIAYLLLCSGLEWSGRRLAGNSR